MVGPLLLTMFVGPLPVGSQALIVSASDDHCDWRGCTRASTVVEFG